ncbi:hypothetical protein Tco_0359832 [Tanacetum coccineum]
MLSISCATSKLAAVVIALSTLSPPPYGQPHLLQGLELEIRVFAQCELQIEVHEKLMEVFQFEVVLFEVLGFAPTWSQKVEYLFLKICEGWYVSETSIEVRRTFYEKVIPSSSLKRRSLLTDDSDITTALPSTIACICAT